MISWEGEWRRRRKWKGRECEFRTRRKRGSESERETTYLEEERVDKVPVIHSTLERDHRKGFSSYCSSSKAVRRVLLDLVEEMVGFVDADGIDGIERRGGSGDEVEDVDLSESENEGGRSDERKERYENDDRRSDKAHSIQQLDHPSRDSYERLHCLPVLRRVVSKRIGSRAEGEVPGVEGNGFERGGGGEGATWSTVGRGEGSCREDGTREREREKEGVISAR